jgi:hypothetical protein
MDSRAAYFLRIASKRHAALDRAMDSMATGGTMWGDKPRFRLFITKYKYMGVMLAPECMWHAHVEHVSGGKSHEG